MFRASIFKRTKLDENPQYDIDIIPGSSVSEDLTQKATSTFITTSVVTGIQDGDLIKVYNGSGKIIYRGIISSVSDNLASDGTRISSNIETDQMPALYNEKHLLVVPTDTDVKNFFKNKPISNVIDYYLKSKEIGQQSTLCSMTSAPGYAITWGGLIDADNKERYKGLEHVVVDKDTVWHMTFPKEKEVTTLEDFIYDSFNEYNRIVTMRELDVPRDNLLIDGYTRVQYIESTGAQYINTGINGIVGLKSTMDVMYVSFNNAEQGTLGANTGNPYYVYLFRVYSDMKLTSYLDNTVLCNTNETIELGKRMTITSQIRSGDSFISINGVVKATSTKTSTRDLSRNLYLFGVNNNNTAGAGANKFTIMRLYSQKIWDINDELIADYIPMIRNSDGVAGLYNLVDETFYPSNSTTPFIAGPKAGSRSNMILIFNPDGKIEYNKGKYLDYTQKVLFDTMETLKNVNIEKEQEEHNTIAIYNNAGTSLRGAYTVALNQETGIYEIVQLVTNTPIEGRIGSNKITFEFQDSSTDGNNLLDIARKYLPTMQYNHKITFDVVFNDIMKFEDFNLGQKIKMYFKNENKVYESILSAWTYTLGETDTVISASFTLGKVRNNLTSKLNLRKVTKKK